MTNETETSYTETPFTKALTEYNAEPTLEKAFAVEKTIKDMIMFAITFIEQARIKIIQSQMNPNFADGSHPDPGLPIPGVNFITKEEYERRQQKPSEDYNEEKVHPGVDIV